MSGRDGGDELAQLSIAERALARAETMPEVLAVRTVAEAARLYAKRARLSLKATNQACLVRLNAEAKAAELIEQLRSRGDLRGRGGVAAQISHPERFGLADLAIDKSEEHRWSRVARSTIEDRMAYAEEATAAGEEVTRTGLAQWLARGSPEPADTPPLPPGRFRCVVIDPPWPVEKIEREDRPDQGYSLDYPTLPIFGGEPGEDGRPRDIEHVAAVPAVAAEEGCHVYLWVVHRFLHEALHLFDAWGVNYQCAMTWVKPVGMTPYSWRYNTEHVLFGRVGNLQLERLGLPLSFEAPVGRGQHSRKPDVFYERVLEASPGPRLEMFARTARDGFEVWGNEVVADVE